MFNLAIATLNMQVIALGVFFGVVAAWTARFVWQQAFMAIWFCAGTTYTFLIAKYRSRQAIKTVAE